MLLQNLQRYSIIGSFLLVAACGTKKQQGMQGPPPVQVAVQKVSTTDASYYEEYPVIVRSLNEVELRPQVNGYVTGMYFKEGERVKKGEKLYSIDPQLAQGNYQQAVANLKVQEANLVKAQKDVDRYRELSKSDAVAKQQVDYAEAAYEAAQKQVDAAKATVSGVQTSVRYTSIVAPFDGIIGISAVRLGASVSIGNTLLNTISTDDPIAADITVDQKQIYKFTQLAKNSTAKDSTFRLAFGEDVYPQHGYISVIDRAVDAQTGSIRMRLIFPNPDHTLRAGMSSTLRVLTNTPKSVVVPFKAVTEQLGEFFVYVADSSKVSQRKVVIGKQLGNSVIIHDGLKEGETIVTEGVQNLREGAAIAVAAPAAPKQ